MVKLCNLIMNLLCNLFDLAVPLPKKMPNLSVQVVARPVFVIVVVDHHGSKVRVNPGVLEEQLRLVLEY